MATTTTNLSVNGNPDLMRKNLLMAKKLYDEKSQRKFAQALAGRVISSDQLFEVVALASGLDLPQVTGEYEVIPTTDAYQAYRKTYTPQKRTLQFRMSDEAFINDQYGIVKSYGTVLSQNFSLAEDRAAANAYMNWANNSALISTPQGSALGSTSHPLETGTDSNTFAIPQTLGAIALEDAVNLLMSQKAHKGYECPKYGPFNLEVAPRNAMNAKRILSATNLAGGDLNDPNVVGKSIDKLIVCPMFTNPEWWALRSASEDEQPRFKLDRYGFKLMSIVYDDDTDSWKVTAKQSYLFDVTDYRGTFYSFAS